ncbi:MAG: mechanosensitive ion channel [Acidobacteria bacterium]|nr:mechanosensitive ion channel [Acidobacteriota bacterium]
MMIRQPAVQWLTQGLICLSFVSAGHGQSLFNWPENTPGTSPAEAEQLPTPEDVRERIAQLEQQIRQIAAAEPGTADPVLADTSRRRERLSLLRRLESVLRRTLEALQRREALTKERTLPKERGSVRTPPDLPQVPPYTLAQYDELYDSLNLLRQQNDTLELARNQARKSREENVRRREEFAQRMRALRKSQADLPSAEVSLPQQWELDQAELEHRLASATVVLETIRTENWLREMEINRQQTLFLERQLSGVGRHLVFEPARLEERLQDIARQKQVLQSQLNKRTRQLQLARERWAGESLTRAEAPAGSAAELVGLERQAGFAWIETHELGVELLQEQQTYLDETEQLWKLRFDLVQGTVPPDALSKYLADIRRLIDRVGRHFDLQQSKQADLYSQISALEKEMTATATDGQEPAWRQEQLRAIRARQDYLSGHLSVVMSFNLLLSRVEHDITSRLDKASVIIDWADFRQSIRTIWEFEVWVIDDHSVQVRDLVVSLIILVLGTFLVRFIIRRFSRRLFRMTQLKESTGKTIEKLLLYAGYLIILLFALRMVNIPLAAFAFLGGAIAIGIGFGAQNLINNFISGFIIMGERPISIGDLVEVEGILGRVEEIGARCTHIRTGENIYILVPNSSFLEKSITNWTLTDRKLRARIRVGVAYGSPVRRVEELLLQAARDNPNVLREPEPFVLFSDFGDNALLFEVHFWISVNRIIERRLIESDLRFAVDDLFRNAGITIAFPQLDVHLDTLKPLEIRLTENHLTAGIDRSD